VLSYRDDPEFARFLSHVPQPFTMKDAEAFVALNLSEPWERSPTFAVVRDGRVIGTVNLEVNAATRTAMLGYAIGRAWWGQGIGTEAARATMDWGIETFGLTRVWASTDSRHVQSQRLLEKLGMRREALRVADQMGRGASRSMRSCTRSRLTAARAHSRIADEGGRDMRRTGGLEYQVTGTGEPALLIHGALIADALLPLTRESALAERHRLVCYRRRGYSGSDPLPKSGLERQTQDAASLLEHLGVDRAHVIGHSGGGAIALQLALDAPRLVHSLVLLEPALFPVEMASALPGIAAPVLEAFRAGDRRRAVDVWMNLANCGSDWQAEVEKRVPGASEQAERDCATFFDVELPSLGEWVFDGERASRIDQPVLYVQGGASGPLIQAARQYFDSLFPRAEAVVVPGIDHLMQMRDPARVAEPIADFLSRHPL
jgi:pimeloyl-ACP methyl ester carboxylesterase